MGEEGGIFKGLGLVAKVGGHPAGEGNDIGRMSHFDLGFEILDFGLRGGRDYFIGEWIEGLPCPSSQSNIKLVNYTIDFIT